MIQYKNLKKNKKKENSNTLDGKKYYKLKPKLMKYD